MQESENSIYHLTSQSISALAWKLLKNLSRCGFPFFFLVLRLCFPIILLKLNHCPLVNDSSRSGWGNKGDLNLLRPGKVHCNNKEHWISETSQWLANSISNPASCLRDGHVMEENNTFRKLGMCPKSWSAQSSCSLVDFYCIEIWLTSPPEPVCYCSLIHLSQPSWT